MARQRDDLRLATFRVDVTPPLGSPLCGGLVKPAAAVADPLWAAGVIILGEGLPIVLSVLDWCELNNASHAFWRKELAAAVGSSPERVAVHTVHQHDAPIADIRAHELLSSAPRPVRVMYPPYERTSRERVAEAAGAAVAGSRRLTHVGWGAARVREVASARRILGPDGRVRATRWSACRDESVRAEPEGAIDPMLRTLRFLGDGECLATLHYYATHPMSSYGEGVVSSDFAGLARERLRAREPGERLYWNGCAGNVTAGKHNDGSPGNRSVLSSRVERAMLECEQSLRVEPLESVEWRTREVRLPERPDLDRAALEAALRDADRPDPERVTAAFRLAYLERLADPLCLSCLRLGRGISLLQLPGEAFVEYQLYSAEQTDRVAVAAYGDTGTGYIPLASSYAEGGYEPGASSVSGESEAILKRSIRELLA